MLVRKDFRWVPTSGGNIPPDAVAAGRTKSGETLYVGRAQHEGALVVGKVSTLYLFLLYFSCNICFRFLTGTSITWSCLHTFQERGTRLQGLRNFGLQLIYVV